MFTMQSYMLRFVRFSLGNNRPPTGWRISYDSHRHSDIAELPKPLKTNTLLRVPKLTDHQRRSPLRSKLPIG
jgi:hypothetical protein